MSGPKKSQDTKKRSRDNGTGESFLANVIASVDISKFPQQIFSGQAAVASRLINGESTGSKSSRRSKRDDGGNNVERDDDPKPSSRHGDSNTAVSRHNPYLMQDAPAQAFQQQQQRGYNNASASPKHCSTCGSRTGECSHTQSSDPCADPYVNVIPVPCKPVKSMLMVPFGFVVDGNTINITDVDLLPFTIVPVEKSFLRVAPNAAMNVTVQGLYEMFGISSFVTGNIPDYGCILPSTFLLGNLPGAYAIFNGIYILTQLPSVLNQSFTLERLQWVNDPCAPVEGSWILLARGVSASTYAVLEINDHCQTFTLGLTGISHFETFRIKHVVAACREEVNYWEVGVRAEDATCGW